MPKLSKTDEAAFYAHFLAAILSKKLNLGQGFFSKRLLAYETRLANRLGVPPVQTPLVAVDRVKQISPEDFQKNYLLKYKPLVLEGFCASWASSKDFSFEALESKYGAFEISPASPLEKTSGRRLTIGEVVRGLRDETYHDFVPCASLLSRFPELAASLDHAAVRRLSGTKNSIVIFNKLFIGPKNYLGTFHNDLTHNFVSNLAGTKSMILCTPSQTPLLYPTGGFLPPRYYSIMTRFRGDASEASTLQEFPLLQHAVKFEATLNPGDVLFMPAFMWHQARYRTPCITVAVGIYDFMASLVHHPLFTFLAYEAWRRGYQLIREARKLPRGLKLGVLLD